MTKTSSPPSVETPGPRHTLPTASNDFSPRQFLAALDILSRRQVARAANLSSLSKLRGV